MAGTQDNNQAGASASTDESLIAWLISDIVDYDVKSFATTSSQEFDASEYHPYDRQIGGARTNTYQSSSIPVYDGYWDHSTSDASNPHGS